MPARCLLSRHVILPRDLTSHSRCAQYATFRSRTALNAAAFKNIPQDNQPLHSALQSLQGSTYLDQSRLSLALKSLESPTPVLRVGILALDAAAERSARLLARTLLSDALSEPTAWEEAITSSTQPAILKYGEEASTAAEVSVPSRFLQRNGLEILLMRAGPEVLSPALETGVTAGYAALLRYPLHRAVVVGKGVDGAVRMGESRLGKGKELIGRVIDIASTSNSQTRSELDTNTEAGLELPEQSGVLPVDITQAHTALQAFRADPSTGPSFNTAWQSSGITSAIAFLAPDLKVALKAYISHLLTSTSSAIDNEHESALTAIQANTIPDSTRNTFQSSISAWSASAHSDLQSSIARIKASPSWRRTSWTGLLWAVDDVAPAADDALALWLASAEIHLAYLTGSVHAAGFKHPAKPQVVPQLGPQHGPDAVSGAHKLLARDLAAQDEFAVDTQVWAPPPWSVAIRASRLELGARLVPDLAARAQMLLAQTLSTVAATGALGGWWSLAFEGGVYEGGAIAALGVVVALRRVQRLWGKEREGFLERIVDAGRVVLRQVEGELRTDVRERGRGGLDSEDVKRWEDARAAVQRCRDELEKM